jgi:predicted RND superfamily exporter protein
MAIILKLPGHPKRIKFILCLSILSLLTAAAFLGSTQLNKLKTQYSMRQFLPKHHELIDREDKVKDSFQLGQYPPILILMDLGKKERGTWLHPARVARLKLATEKLGSYPGILGGLSIATVEGAMASKEGVTIGRLLAGTHPRLWQKRVLEDPLLVPQLISKDARTIVIALDRTDLPNDTIHKITIKARKDLERRFPEAIIQIGGVPTIQAEMSHLLSKELATLSLYALLAMAITLFLIFSNFSSVLATLYVTAMANIAVLALMAITGTTFTILSTTLPILISLNTVSMVAYTLVRFAEISAVCLDKELAIKQVTRETFGPNLLASATTCVGFGALCINRIPLIVEYGAVVAFSIFVSWALSMIAIPPLLYLLPTPRPRRWTSASARWSLWITSNAKPVFASTIGLTLIFGFFALNQNWSAQLFDEMPATHEARRTTERIDKKLGGMIPLELIISYSDANAWNDPNRIARLDSLAKSLRQEKGIGSAVSLADFLRAGNLTDKEDLPKSRAGVAETLFLYSMSDSRPTDSFLANDGREARVAIRINDLPAATMASLVSKTSEKAQRLFPDAKVSPSGMATTVHELNNELSIDLIYGFWQALFFIAAFLIVYYRSFRWTLVAILPNLLPPILLLGVMGLVSEPIKPGLAIVFSIALGIAFNNTVYFLGRLRLLYTENPDHPSDRKGIPVKRALFLEGTPCLLSTLPHAIGFTVFLASNFGLNQTFGTYMLISVVAGVIGDLVLLPTMLQLFPGLLKPVIDRKKRAKVIVFDSQTTVIISSEERPEKESEMQHPAAIAGILIAAMISTNSWAAGDSSKEILDRVNKNMKASDESATIHMRILEKNGSAKDREMTIQRKSEGDKKHVLVRLLAPGDIRGTGLLSVEKNNKKDQWLFLPSTKKSRRILSQNQGGNFMGSELSYEDMGGSQGVEFSSRLLRTDKKGAAKIAVIESRPKAGESAYSKIVSWIPLDKYVVEKAEYYDKSGKLLKVADFANYKKFDNKTWRATKMQIRNVQNGRATIMALKGLSVNRGIDPDNFSVANLEELE